MSAAYNAVLKSLCRKQPLFTHWLMCYQRLTWRPRGQTTQLMVGGSETHRLGAGIVSFAHYSTWEWSSTSKTLLKIFTSQVSWVWGEMSWKDYKKYSFFELKHQAYHDQDDRNLNTQCNDSLLSLLIKINLVKTCMTNIHAPGPYTYTYSRLYFNYIVLNMKQTNTKMVVLDDVVCN